MMNVFILMTGDVPSRPDFITLLQDFGRDTIVDDDGRPLVEGTVCLVDATPKQMKDWLGETEVWVTAHPMFSPWMKTRVPSMH